MSGASNHPPSLRILEQLGISSALIAGRGLLPCTEATSLEVAEVGGDGKEHLLVPEAATAWRRLKHAAAQEGESLFIVSAFRSVARQVEIIRRKLDAGVCIEEIVKVSAPPGYSEHHSGCAVDLSAQGAPLLELEFERTSAFGWLQRRAAQFGFRLSFPPGNSFGYQYEPWHWCYVAARREPADA